MAVEEVSMKKRNVMEKRNLRDRGRRDGGDIGKRV